MNQTTTINTEELLRETRMLNFTHPQLTQLQMERGWSSMNTYSRIESIYNFVRDEIFFGYNRRDDIPASEVLKDGYGQCNTKATLLMALLRQNGIPCRLHGFTIHRNLQKGAIDGLWYRLAPAEIIHSWVEIHYDEQWIELEGFIIDRSFLTSVQSMFPEVSGEFCGFGIATQNLGEPPIDWCGRNTYIQKEGIARDFGLFAHPDDFYELHGANLTGLRRTLYENFVRHRINARVRFIREFTG
ncbi:MAG: transglutaminase domain-containing protein [Leptospiraceae bacterium]|nr:transglutaminase domain-containing protein [Leptospiraceae bacterium]MCB1320694.1 transglutaminase domain-containing protein [Leptospiraceae bacterium]